MTSLLVWCAFHHQEKHLHTLNSSHSHSSSCTFPLQNFSSHYVVRHQAQIYIFCFLSCPLLSLSLTFACHSMACIRYQFHRVGTAEEHWIHGKAMVSPTTTTRLHSWPAVLPVGKQEFPNWHKKFV